MEWYIVDYWDVFLDKRRVYRTNCFSLAFERISQCYVTRYFVYFGYVEEGLFFPVRLVARSATYLGV